MKKTITFSCIQKGCSERGNYERSSLKEINELRSKYQNSWKCVRHTNPDKVLSKNNPKRQIVLIAKKSRKYPELKELFWDDVDGNVGSGFEYGPGFKAYANDFQEGTELIITAEIKVKNEKIHT